MKGKEDEHGALVLQEQEGKKLLLEQKRKAFEKSVTTVMLLSMSASSISYYIFSFFISFPEIPGILAFFTFLTTFFYLTKVMKKRPFIMLDLQLIPEDENKIPAVKMLKK
ncbi:MAG: hypothetical protein Q8O88_06305 [bacterium]|nr:hypothetical protein [bacterium]